jgi:hypothetical protein
MKNISCHVYSTFMGGLFTQNSLPIADNHASSAKRGNHDVYPVIIVSTLIRKKMFSRISSFLKIVFYQFQP